MSAARTPNPWAGPRARPHVDLDTYDQRADDPISQYVQGRPLTIQNAQEAREAYEDCRNVALALRKQRDTLTADNAALREALMGLTIWFSPIYGAMTNRELLVAGCLNDLQASIAKARAALAKAGA